MSEWVKAALAHIQPSSMLVSEPYAPALAGILKDTFPQINVEAEPAFMPPWEVIVTYDALPFKKKSDGLDILHRYAFCCKWLIAAWWWGPLENEVMRFSSWLPADFDHLNYVCDFRDGAYFLIATGYLHTRDDPPLFDVANRWATSGIVHTLPAWRNG